jgi:hypothetical protein
MAAAPDEGSRETVDRGLSNPLIRGDIVFQELLRVSWERGDSVAQAAKLYAGLNLAIRLRPVGYDEKIIRKGGEAVGASPPMPPWQEELSDE